MLRADVLGPSSLPGARAACLSRASGRRRGGCFISALTGPTTRPQGRSRVIHRRGLMGVAGGLASGGSCVWGAEHQRRRRPQDAATNEGRPTSARHHTETDTTHCSPQQPAKAHTPIRQGHPSRQAPPAAERRKSTAAPAPACPRMPGPVLARSPPGGCCCPALAAARQRATATATVPRGLPSLLGAASASASCSAPSPCPSRRGLLADDPVAAVAAAAPARFVGQASDSLGVRSGPDMSSDANAASGAAAGPRRSPRDRAPREQR
jgi:hypothetical protein